MQLSLRSTSSLLQKAVAVAALAAAGLLFYYLTNLPLAVNVAGFEWKTGARDEIVLAPAGNAREPFISIDGAENEGVDVRFEDALLQDSAGLRSEFGLEFPATQGPIAWTTESKGHGRTTVDIAVEPKTGTPKVHVSHVGAEDHPGLQFSAHNATLTVRLAVILDESDTKKLLRIGQGAAISLPGAIPITVAVPEGREFSITFPVAKPRSEFHLGSPDKLSAEGFSLAVRQAGTRERPNGEYRLYACAAKPGSRLWALAGLRADECSTAESLHAANFQLDSDSISLAVTGTAFVLKDGVAETDDWFSKIENNKPIAAFLSLVFAALAAWAWKAFSSKRDGEKDAASGAKEE